MGIDLGKLSRAPWEWWTSNSYNRLSGPDGKDGGVLRGVVYRDGQTGIEGKEVDMAFIALARQVFDTIMRYGWSVKCHGGQFAAFRPAVVAIGGRTAYGEVAVMEDDSQQGYRADPFTAVRDARLYWESRPRTDALAASMPGSSPTPEIDG